MNSPDTSSWTISAACAFLLLEPTQERIESLVDALDLEDYIDRRIATYSKGTRQKLAFVQILLHGPDVLFLDEPTEGLDPRAARTSEP